MKIKVANGPVEIRLVFCEWTGKALCWQTVISPAQYQKGITPAYLGFDVISEDGTVLINTIEIETF